MSIRASDERDRLLTALTASLPHESWCTAAECLDMDPCSLSRLSAAQTALDAIAPLIGQGRADLAVAEERARWTRWLAVSNYGIDYASTPDPPCTAEELAEAYLLVEASQGMTAVEWVWCMRMNTGAFPEAAGADI